MVALTDDIKKVLSLTDLVLLDIKHIDDEKCKELVGFSNKLELTFARYLSDHDIPIWIRQVLVPGYTDDEQDLLKLKDFITSLKTVKKVELLSYHDMGKFKWKKLGFDYALENVRNANFEDVEKAKKILGICEKIAKRVRPSWQSFYIPNNFNSIFSILYLPSTNLNSTKVSSKVSLFCLKSVVKYNLICGIST